MKYLDEHGDVQKVSMSATTTNGLLEIARISIEIYVWISTAVIRMYRFGEEPDERDINKAFENCESEILKSYVKTILEDARMWSYQGRAGIKAGSSGGKASAAKRQKKINVVSDSDIQSIKQAKIAAAK